MLINEYIHNSEPAIAIRQKAITTAETPGKYLAIIEDVLTDKSASASIILIFNRILRTND